MVSFVNISNSELFFTQLPPHSVFNPFNLPFIEVLCCKSQTSATSFFDDLSWGERERHNRMTNWSPHSGFINLDCISQWKKKLMINLCITCLIIKLKKFIEKYVHCECECVVGFSFSRSFSENVHSIFRAFFGIFVFGRPFLSCHHSLRENVAHFLHFVL